MGDGLCHRVFLGGERFAGRFVDSGKRGEALREVPQAQRRPLAKPLEWFARDYRDRREAMARAFGAGASTQCRKLEIISECIIRQSVEPFRGWRRAPGLERAEMLCSECLITRSDPVSYMTPPPTTCLSMPLTCCSGLPIDLAGLVLHLACSGLQRALDLIFSSCACPDEKWKEMMGGVSDLPITRCRKTRHRTCARLWPMSGPTSRAIDSC